MLLLITLFFVPGVMMIVAYGLISRELFRGIQFELGQNKDDKAGELHQKYNRTCENEIQKLPDISIPIKYISVF